MIRHPISWLYVPGDRPDRFGKAAASGAHVVIVDLEDAVPPGHKVQARGNALDFLHDAEPGTVELRVNDVRTETGVADLAAMTPLPALRAVRLPKVQTAADVHQALRTVHESVAVSCLVESALGVENAYAIASASPRIAAISLGEADLASDLGAASDGALSYARSRIIIAARAAGLPSPAQSVYPNVADLAGLRTSCQFGRGLGFVGRAAIHPRQIPVIHDAYRPGDEEIAAAQAVLDALATSNGVTALADGRMVDEAMRRRAEQVIALAATFQ